MKTQHTPTPWRVRPEFEYRDGSLWIDGADNLMLASVSDLNKKDTSIRDANAELIVRAVNSHEALLRELKKVLRMFYESNDVFPEEPESDGNNQHLRLLDVEKLIKQAEGK